MEIKRIGKDTGIKKINFISYFLFETHVDKYVLICLFFKVRTFFRCYLIVMMHHIINNLKSPNCVAIMP